MCPRERVEEKIGQFAIFKVYFFPVVLLNTNCLKRHWASWKILGWVYVFYNFNEPHNSRYIQFGICYQYCRYRKFDQYWVCIELMSYWPLHCTSYITLIDIVNIAKQILHQFYIVSCLHQTSCLHRQRRHRNVFRH